MKTTKLEAHEFGFAQFSPLSMPSASSVVNKTRLIQEVVAVFRSICKVVQYHRRLRPIAPGSFSTNAIGERRNSNRNAINPWRASATELDHCQVGVSCGLAAAHSCCAHSGGAQRDGRHRVSQTAGNALRHALSILLFFARRYRRKPSLQATSRKLWKDR